MYAGTVNLEQAGRAARAACDLLEGLEEDEPSLAAAALGARVRADLFLGHGFDAEAAERAYALETSASTLPMAVDGRVVFRLGQWLRYVDDLENARARLEEAEQQAHDEGDDASLGNILLNRLIVETWSGNWDEATAVTTRMSEAFEQQGVEPEGIGPWKAYLHAYAGRLDETRTAAGKRPSEPTIAAIHDRCLGLAELAAGNAAEADRYLSRAVEIFDQIDFREPAIWRLDGDAVEAAVANGAPTARNAWCGGSSPRPSEQASHGTAPSPPGAAVCSSQLAASSRTPPPCSTRPSPSTRRVRCSTSGHARCWFRGRCYAV